MAANLLAEFEDFYQPGTTRLTPNTDTDIKASTNQPVQGSDLRADHADIRTDDDDDFGEFESARPVKPRPVSLDKPLPARPARDNSVPPRPPPKVRDENVLFDAEDDDDGADDFGDFEEAPKSPALYSHGHSLASTIPSKHTKQESLIDFDDDPTPSTTSTAVPKVAQVQAPTRPARPKAVQRTQPKHVEHDLLGLDDARPQPAQAPAAPKANTSTSNRQVKQIVVETVDDNEWDDFETAEPSVAAAPNMSSSSDDALHPLPLDEIMLPELPANNELPPTNIPPPAILLTVFPLIASSAKNQLFDPLSQLNGQPEVRDRVIQLPQTRIYLQALLQATVVLARIIAGRKNRWKRDTMLAQSMRIGPAGKSGGMKLAGVDKAENAREEREVSDAVRAWQAQVGRLKSAVNTAGSIGSVPTVTESYMVRVAPAGEGAINSPKACILCGLKRNERIAKVDSNVQDSFGEWWVEHWGHNDCARLWYAQKDALKSR